MFNLIKFNRGKFNVVDNQESITAAAAAIGLATSIANTKSRLTANAIIDSQTLAEMVKQITTEIPEQNGKSVATITGVKKTTMTSIKIEATAETAGRIEEVFGYEVIGLSKIVLRPGDELIINSEDLTITLNGKNAMEYLDNGDFFDLKQGKNILIYDDKSTVRTLNLKVLHKNRWL